ncbi:hypothetical protein V6N12_027657 [Hibiscus sabdariffa]|uniref:Protein kinase domain-containing protein n=1 Tax=Hibiscus sabdariffa TaxID=183260 RepID=A0ABR2F3I7_9ROSI
MGVGVVFYFILQLPWLVPAVTATGATRPYGRCSNDCDETCGNVPIPHPFGIRSGCYAYNNSWFRVTCKETATGQKPFIGRINLELVDSYLVGENSVVVVNNPVIYLNCENKRTTSPSSVNLQGSPFFFSGRFNQFGSVGCDNFAAAFRNNQTSPISSCLQNSCGHMASTLHVDGCQAIISQNVTSYTASVREVIRPNAAGSQRCTSAFLFSDPRLIHLASRFYSYGSDPMSGLAFPDDISINTTHVPAALEWNPCDLEDARCQTKVRHGCIRSCGNVDIPYPFGIEAGCYMNGWFRVTCNETTDAPKVYLTSFGLQLLRISVSEGTVVVNNPVTYSNCIKANRVGVNRMGRLICANFGTANVSCSSDIPSARSSYAVNMKDIYPNIPSRRLCMSAFVVDQRYLKTIILHGNGTSNWTVSHVPTTLQWCTRIRGWCNCKYGPNVFPSFNGQYRGRKLGQNYLCVCSVDDDGFVSTDRCQGMDRGVLEETIHFVISYTYMLCLNAPGNKCSSSSCPEGYQYSGDACMPVKKLTEKSKNSHYLAISIGCSTSLGTLFVLLGTWHLYKVLERRKTIKLKKKYFKRNGGLLLQQQMSNNEGKVEKLRLFTSEELEKATDYFNENRILGRGGQGTVYKGMLMDGSIVAIKKSKLVEEKIFDETKLEQFINEVMILSQINHRNVVKLLGCCLETKVPLLVYEFVPNGTLYHLIHDPNEEFLLTWEMRFRIAIETANALSYLHSAASVPIYHRDIKSRQKPISSSQSEEVVRSLANFFLLSMKENSLLDIVDPVVQNGGPEEEIVAVAKLAKRCLNLNGKKRPTMKQVALELEWIRSSEEANAIQQSADEDSDTDDMLEYVSSITSCSTTGSVLKDSVTLSLDA